MAILCTCRARLDHLHRTPADTLLTVPDPALVPAQGVLLLLLLALAGAGLAVEGVPGVPTHLLLLEAGALAGGVLLYGDGGTGLVTDASTQPTLGEDDRDLAGCFLGGHTAVGCGVAASST